MIIFENRFFPLRSAVCFLVEGGIILVSVLVSFLILRTGGYVEVVDVGDAVVRGLVVALFCQTCMYFLDLYDLTISRTRGELFFSLLFSVGVVCIGIGLISFLIPALGVEGRMYYLTVLFVAVLLLLWRLGFDAYLRRIAPAKKIAVVGTGDTARMVAREIEGRERLGFRFVGFIGEPSNGVDKPGDGERILGGYADLCRIVEDQGIAKIVVAINERRGFYPVREMLSARVSGCAVAEWQGFFEKLSGRIPIDNLAPSFFIFNDGFGKSRVVLFLRRLASMVVAAVALAILAPLFLVIAVLIKLDSVGPVFYTQMRVGQHGKEFRIFKFRSMREDAEIDGSPRWASENDPRVTRVGRVIRATRLDEAPQLFNVLRGDIDLVGPRPERPRFVEELERQIPFYSIRHTVKPGLTGWAQVMFTYCGTIAESKEKLQYDLFYIKNMSLKLDLLIMFRTIKIILLGRGAR